MGREKIDNLQEFVILHLKKELRVTMGCLFLSRKIGSRPIVRRWRIRIENYCKVFFLFSKKTRIGKRNRELLELLRLECHYPSQRQLLPIVTKLCSRKTKQALWSFNFASRVKLVPQLSKRPIWSPQLLFLGQICFVY